MALDREQDLDAGELALRLLEGEERALALRRQLSDPEFALAVADWERRLDRLRVDGPGVEPPSELLDRILERIGGAPRRTTTPWRWAAIGSAALAAGLAAALLVQPQHAPTPRAEPTAPTPAGFARLEASPGKQLLARYEPQTGELRLKGEGLSDPNRRPELWVIPKGGKPHSLGAAPAEGTHVTRVPLALRPYLVGGATLALTMEKPAGIPHQAPSTEPMARGKLSLV